jgi:hypothetical protein
LPFYNHRLLRFLHELSFTKKGSISLFLVITLKREGRSGRGSGERCGYEATGAMPVVVIVVEKEKALEIWYMTLHAKLFGHHKNEMA